MPQELNVLKCYKCHFFQVHIVKKVKKWQCKVCEEKQSIIKIYYQGSGKECRLFVQNANQVNIEQNLLESPNIDRITSTKEFTKYTNQSQEFTKDEDVSKEINQNSSEWDQYLSSEEENDLSTENNDVNFDLEEKLKKSFEKNVQVVEQEEYRKSFNCPTFENEQDCKSLLETNELNVIIDNLKKRKTACEISHSEKKFKEDQIEDNCFFEVDLEKDVITFNTPPSDNEHLEKILDKKENVQDLCEIQQLKILKNNLNIFGSADMNEDDLDEILEL